MNKQLLITSLSAFGVAVVSYWSFTRGELLNGIIGTLLIGASVTAFMYELRNEMKKSNH